MGHVTRIQRTRLCVSFFYPCTVHIRGTGRLLKSPERREKYMDEILLSIKNGSEQLTSGLGGVLRVCGIIIVVLLAAVAVISLYGEIRAAVLHEKPAEVEGVKPLSTKVTLIADAAMFSAAAVLLVVIL